MKDEMNNAGRTSDFRKMEREDVNRIPVQNRIQWHSYKHCNELQSSTESTNIS
jgi:hypothetical protein